MPPTYRDRLRIEGAVLAATGAVGSALLLVTTDEARRWPLNSAAQLAAVAALLAVVGPRVTRAHMRKASELEPGREGTGEPTPLWSLPLIVGGLTVPVVVAKHLALPLALERFAGWDAGLRVTAGSAIVGLAQCVLLERVVAAEERRAGRRFVRAAGSSLLRGTKLGMLPRASEQEPEDEPRFTKDPAPARSFRHTRA